MKYWFAFLLPVLCHLSLKGQPRPGADTPNSPRLLHFAPVFFSNKFSIHPTPVLHLQTGDTVYTETIDAFGRDKNGSKRQGGGNPLTGPFYIENAKAGDVLQVELVKVSLNRPYAYTTESFVSRSMPDSIARQFRKPAIVKWKLDIDGKTGSADSTYSGYKNLENFKVPLHPFLGCIGVAPRNKKNEILSFFQGNFGGNMDFKRIAESSKVYLPVFHDGAYLYIGDGHAVQGDGEIAGNALETSLDIMFTVTIIKGDSMHLKYPRIEDSVFLMTAGSGKTMENALKVATAGLLEWLQNRYRINVQEASQVLSTTVEYTVAEIADPEVIVVAKIQKKLLEGLRGHE